MLYWSQDASTGWTRNSWEGSIAKVEDVPFCALQSLGSGRGDERRGGRSNLPSGSRPAQRRHAQLQPDLTLVGRAATLARRVPPSAAESSARGGQPIVTASESAFRWLGLRPGGAAGAAPAETARSRPPPSRG